jgi:hypothetical protein
MLVGNQNYHAVVLEWIVIALVVAVVVLDLFHMVVFRALQHVCAPQRIGLESQPATCVEYSDCIPEANCWSPATAEYA